MNCAFTWPVRVYYEDVDLGGIVYYANYLRFLERARTEWLRALGIEQLPLKEQHGLIFAVVELHSRFRKPARFDDLLQVSCTVLEVTRASLTLRQEIHRQQQHGELLLDGQVRLACLDAHALRPQPLPPPLVSKLNLAGVK